MGAPVGTDWGFGTATQTTIPVTRLVAVPGGAVTMVAQAFLTSTMVQAGTQPFSAASPVTITGLNANTSYRVRAAWADAAGVPVSDWSPLKPAATLP